MQLHEPARVPAEAFGIMTARTLANSPPALLARLAPGRSVLDVGCGPGTLTIEIARHVAPGAVVGMDVNPEMIAAAETASPPGAIPGLVFYRGDIQRSDWDREFDIVNAARVLQWIPDAGAAVAAMARAARPGGAVVVLDFDHGKARWTRPPAEWTRFYRAFLAWRAAAGLDNAIADHLAAMCSAAGLRDVRTLPQIETVRAGEPDFYRAAGIWRLVIESRGRQMVAAGHLSEPDRRAALDAYTGWMQSPHAVQTLHQAAVVATVPAAQPSRGAAQR